MTATPCVAALAVLELLLGLVLVLLGRGMRQRPGLGQDGVARQFTLTSRHYGLTGRPDRLVKGGGTVIIEEWKSGRAVPPMRPAGQLRAGTGIGKKPVGQGAFPAVDSLPGFLDAGSRGIAPPAPAAANRKEIGRFLYSQNQAERGRATCLETCATD